MRATFNTTLRALALAALSLAGGAQAANSLNLGNYAVSASYALAINPGSQGVSGLEASAVTYARDRGTLFYVGDEGTGVVEISRTGQTLGTMVFDWSGTGSSKHDTEGLAYIGNGQLVVSEERLYDAYRFSFVNGGTAKLSNAGVSISNDNVGNEGLEGLSYDPRNGGSFVTVKQMNPQDVRAGTLNFGPNLGGAASTVSLFNAASLGVASLSDVAVLAAVDGLAGTPGADNLLILSLESRKLLEVDRQGHVLSFLDLANVLPRNGIEGVTVDEHGTIYLVAEQIQDGLVPPLEPQSQLIVLNALAPVPEPASAVLMLAGGLGLAGWAKRRRLRKD